MIQRKREREKERKYEKLSKRNEEERSLRSIKETGGPRFYFFVVFRINGTENGISTRVIEKDERRKRVREKQKWLEKDEERERDE